MFSQLKASSGLFVVIHSLCVLPLSTWDSARLITKPSATPSTTGRELERGKMWNIITTAEHHPICEELPVPVPAWPTVLIAPTPALSSNKRLFIVLELCWFTGVLKQVLYFYWCNRTFCSSDRTFPPDEIPSPLWCCTPGENAAILILLVITAYYITEFSFPIGLYRATIEIFNSTTIQDLLTS